MGATLQSICGLVIFVCYVIVIVKMFQNGKGGLAILTLLLGCLCGIGGIIAFVYGWLRRNEWNLTPVMIVWTIAIILMIVANIVFEPAINQEQINQWREQYGPK